MTSALETLVTAETYRVLLVFARAGTALMLLPGFGEAFVPPRIRLAAAVVVAFVLAGTDLGGPVSLPHDAGRLAAEVGVEALAGLVIGLLARLALLALHIAGALIAQQTSLSQFMPSAVAPEGTPALGNLLLLAGISLIFALDLHLELIQALRDSYAVLPLGTPPDFALFAERITGAVAAAFTVGVRLAMPFLVLGFLVQLGLGIANSAMPTMMVYFVAAPGLTVAGLVLLAFVLPALLLAWADSFRDLVQLG